MYSVLCMNCLLFCSVASQLHLLNEYVNSYYNYNPTRLSHMFYQVDVHLIVHLKPYKTRIYL